MNVEKIARAMAVADGYDPDEILRGGPNDFTMRACEFTGHAIARKGPAWKKYMRQANLFIAAQREVS